MPVAKKKSIQERPKAYSYVRFSTPDQAKGDSKRRQLEMAESYASANGLELDESLTFHDLGVSAYKGKNFTEGRLGAFREAVRVGAVKEGSVLLVESLDRLSRQNFHSALSLLRDIVMSGVDVVTVTDGKRYGQKELEDPMSWLMAFFVFVRGNEESATKARRVRQAWDKKRNKARETGEVLTDRVPAWIERGTNGKLVLNKERARIVRELFKRTLKGEGQHALAESLNQDRVAPFGASRYWHRSYVHKILTSPSAYGTLVPHITELREGKHVRVPQDPIPGYYPAAVSKEDFDRVQIIKGSRRTKVRGEQSQVGTAEVRNIFGGLLRCPICGGTMSMVYKGKRSKRKVVCRKAKEGAGCRYRVEDYAALEAAFFREGPRILAFPPAGDNGEAADKELNAAEGELSEITERIRAVVEAIERQTEPSPVLLTRLAELEEQQQQAKLARDAAYQAQREAYGPLTESRVAAVEAFLEGMKGGEMTDRAELNALLRLVFAEIVVDFSAGQMLFKWKHGGEPSCLTYGPPDSFRKAKGSKTKRAQVAAGRGAA